MRRTERRLKRSALKRTTQLKRSRPRKVDQKAQRAFRDAARFQGACQVTGKTTPWDAHHVIERAWLRRNTPEFEWEPRNALRVIKRVHERHTNGVVRIPMRFLTDDNVAFAYKVMGPFAFYYLKARYSGTDKRVELAFSELEIEETEDAA